MPNNLLVTMSGGTTTVINATLVGIIRQARREQCYARVLAGVPGIKGALKASLADLTALDESQLESLRTTPGSASVGTTRVSILSESELQQFGEVCDRFDIGAFVNIGGNGTIKQTRAISSAFSSRLQVAATPKTVDNDLGDQYCKEVFFTPGFPSCVNYWAKTIKLLDIENRGAASHDQVIVAQTFGRETGFLAGAARIADPERQLPLLLLLPEDPQPVDKVCSAVSDLVARAGRAIVIASEGYPIGDVGTVHDATGQTMYGSSRTTAAQLLVDRLITDGIQARSFIPTIYQRQAIDDTLNFDLDIAEQQGAYTVKRLADGESDFLTTIRDPLSVATESSLIGKIPFSRLDDFSRSLNDTFIAKGQYDVSDMYVQYLKRILETGSVETRYGYPPGSFLSPDVISNALL